MTIEKKFIELYNNPQITTRQIRKQLNMEYNKFYKLRNKLAKQGKIKPRTFHRPPKTKKPVKNYTKSHVEKYYQIKKNGIYYGSCKTAKQAERMVELFRENNWNVELKDKIKKQVYEEIP